MTPLETLKQQFFVYGMEFFLYTPMYLAASDQSITYMLMCICILVIILYLYTTCGLSGR